MIRLVISDSHTDCDFYLEDHKKFYKRCKRPELFSKYAAAFEKEWLSMRNLQEKYPDLTCFPSYLHYGLDKKSAPYICMEYIPGITLEAYLVKHYDPRQPLPADILATWQLRRIMEQVSEMLSVLYSCDILYFDLNPSNMIITNTETFDLTCIDFTFCYDQAISPAENRALSYKRNDSRLNPNHPVSLQIANAMLFFFVQLFYPGKTAYIRHFSSQTVTDFFEARYGNHFHTLFCTLEDFTRHDLADLENPPSQNQLFWLWRSYEKLMHSLL